MPNRDIIVIGASAGGVAALKNVVRGLPAGFPASIFVVCHFPPEERSILPEILSRSGPLLASHAVDGEAFLPGQIYVAPPDRHLLLAPDGRMRLSREARENHHRPAVDPLFRSAARYFGGRVVGVVLTGAMYDGTAGLMAVRAAGGLAVVQDPSDALIAAMPENAARLAGVDFMAASDAIAPLLMGLIQQPVERESGNRAMDPIERMKRIVAKDMARQAEDARRGEVTIFTCPECGGTLWQLDDAEVLGFRCHVGHAYHADVLLSTQTEALEAALWTAVRRFKEQWLLANQLAGKARAVGDVDGERRYCEMAEQASRFGRLIEHHLLSDRHENAESGRAGQTAADGPSGRESRR